MCKVIVIDKCLFIRGEIGLGEWYGVVNFEYLVLVFYEILRLLFLGLFDEEYRLLVMLICMGEGVDELYD